MTDEAPKVETPAAPAPKEVDVDAIVARATKDATAAATEAAEAKMRRAFAIASGQEDKPPANPIHQAFVEDPMMLLNTHKDLIKKELKAEQAVEKKRDTEIAEAMRKSAAEWPQITDYIDVVEGKFIQLKMAEPDKSEAELIASASKSIAERFKLTPLSQAEQEARAKSASLPPAHGSSPYGSGPSNFDNKKSSEDFIAARQAQYNSYTKPK